MQGKFSTMSGDAEEFYELPSWSVGPNVDIPLANAENVGYESDGLITGVDQLTLETKIKIFVFLFSIIVVPAAIVFLVCYLRDIRKQKRYESRVATLLSENPDPSLTYRERLTRPVPGSMCKDKENDKPIETTNTKSRKVSFANEEGAPNTP